MNTCKECGLLAVRDEFTEGAFEATDFTRDRGRHKSSNGTSPTAKVFCYAKSSDFPSCARGKPEEVVESLSIEIACNKFMEWHPGREPKEHYEMNLLQEVERKNRESRDEDRHEREEYESRIDSRFIVAEVNQDRRNRWNLVIQLMLCILTVVVTLIAAKLLPFYDLWKPRD